MRLFVLGKTSLSMKFWTKGNEITRKSEDYSGAFSKALALKRSSLDPTLVTNVDEELVKRTTDENITLAEGTAHVMPIALEIDGERYEEKFDLEIPVPDIASDDVVLAGKSTGCGIEFMDYTERDAKNMEIERDATIFLSEKSASELASFEKKIEKEEDVLDLFSSLVTLSSKARFVVKFNHGAYYVHKMELAYSGEFKTFRIDERGAMDAFIAYYTASILNGLDEEGALKVAMKAEGLSASRYGDALSMPYESDIFA